MFLQFLNRMVFITWFVVSKCGILVVCTDTHLSITFIDTHIVLN